MPKDIYVSKYQLHMWEEPVISGVNGSGTVFFTGCSLGCIYCQNHSISNIQSGKKVSVKELKDIFFRLKDMGAHNINLVTPTHYIDKISQSIYMAKNEGIDIPFVYNTSGYENVDTLKTLDGLIDIYLTDFKYIDEKTALKYSNAKDYVKIVKDAIDEMVRQNSECNYSQDGTLLKKGVIIRHMLIPSHIDEAKKILSYLFSKYQNSVIYSIMSQYTPIKKHPYPNLNRKVRKKEYDFLVSHALSLGIENAFIQDIESASENFIPDFN